MAFSAPGKPNIQYYNVAAGASSAAFRGPYQSYQNTTFLIYPGTSTVAVQVSPHSDDGNWIALTGMTAVAANTVLNYQGPLPWIRFTVTGGTTADCFAVLGDNL